MPLTRISISVPETPGDKRLWAAGDVAAGELVTVNVNGLTETDLPLATANSESGGLRLRVVGHPGGIDLATHGEWTRADDGSLQCTLNLATVQAFDAFRPYWRGGFPPSHPIPYAPRPAPVPEMWAHLVLQLRAGGADQSLIGTAPIRILPWPIDKGTIDLLNLADGKVYSKEEVDRILEQRDADLEETLASQIAESLSGKANLVGGKVPSDELPSYVDDVVEYASLADFPEEGEEGKIYVAKNANKTYRWSGTQYTKVGGDDAILTSIYSDTPTFSEWTISPQADISLELAADGNIGWIAYAPEWEDYTLVEAPEDATELSFTGWDDIDYTATRVRTDIIGYTLGDQPDKPLAPAGNYAKKSEVPVPSDAPPAMDGAASAGSSAAYARSDHRHPTDTTRASVADATLNGRGPNHDGFSEWTVVPPTYQGSRLTPHWVADAGTLYWELRNESGERIVYRVGGEHGEDALELNWDDGEPFVFSATRTALPGYVLGSQTEKPIPKLSDIPAVVAPSTDASAAGKAADAKATGDALNGKLNKTGDTMTGGLTVPDLTVGSRAAESTVGVNSVAEGYGITASGDYSHAEGYGTTADGNGSHAEGGVTWASGDFSHTEGDNTRANGYASHAEGASTITQNFGEHAQGAFNASHTGTTDAEKTIHSIGVGTPISARANAVEVMGDGKVFVKGVGGYNGTNPTGAQDPATDLAAALAAKQDAISDLATIRSGAAAGATAMQPRQRNLLDFTDGATLAPGVAVYRTAATLSGTDATIPTPDATAIATAPAYYCFEMEVAIPAVATTITGPVNWVWVQGGELPDPAIAVGKTVYIAARLNCTTRETTANVWRMA